MDPGCGCAEAGRWRDCSYGCGWGRGRDPERRIVRVCGGGRGGSRLRAGTQDYEVVRGSRGFRKFGIHDGWVERWKYDKREAGILDNRCANRYDGSQDVER